MPKYSIIVPVFNLEKQICRCIDSLLAQSIEDFELILVDDGSQDGSLRICNDYAKKDRRVKVIHQENSGVSAARNAGLGEFIGEYLVFVDGDDYVDFDYLESMDTSEADLVMSGYLAEDEEGEKLYENLFRSLLFSIDDKYIIKEEFEIGHFNSVWAKRFSRRIVKENSISFDNSLSMGEDLYFVISYLRVIQTIESIPGRHYHYINYHSKTTLTNSSLRKKTLDDEEKSDDRIYNQLKQIIPDMARKATAFRIGRVYQTYIENYFNNSGLVNNDFIRHLYRKKWFLRSLMDDRLYKCESGRFKLLLKTRSFFLLKLYKCYKEAKNPERKH